MKKNNCNIAICVVAYNRVISLKRLLNSLSNAKFDEEVSLIISIDKSDTDEVKNIAETFFWNNGQKRIITHSENLGLRRHILQCGNLLDEFDALIVLEDDVEVAPSFYIYSRQCVKKYFYDDDIAGISLYSFSINYHNRLPFMPIATDSDIYLMQCAQSWGQVWMKRQWKAFLTWYEKNSDEFEQMPHLPKSISNWPKSSWLKYHTRYCIENKKYFIYPYHSLSTNFSDAGVHSKEQSTLFQVSMLSGQKSLFNLAPTVLYDGFFENELIYKSLGYKCEDLCVDLYGEKENGEFKRFLLTCKKYDYKLIDTYGLSKRPIELNVMDHVEGEDIYLYDTSIKIVNGNRDKCKKRDLFLYNLDLSSTQRLSPNINLRTIIKRKIVSFIRKWTTKF